MTSRRATRQRSTRRIQPRTPGEVKLSSYAGLPQVLKDCIHRDAIRWNCSHSLIQATALAAFYDVDIVTPWQKKGRDK